MKASERPKKPRAKRTKPIRSWSGLFAAPEAAAPKATKTVGRAARNGAQTIPEAVQLGYTVIQDYLDEARQEAQRVGGTRTGSAASPDPQRLTQRLFQYTSDLTNLWLEILQSTTLRDTSREGPRGTAGPFTGAHRAEADAGYAAAPAVGSSRSAPAAATGSVPPGVLLKVSASRRVEVSIELRPTPILGRLVAHALRSTDPEGPRIERIEIAFQPSDHRVSVEVPVPDDLPSGVYSGLFIDRHDNLPRGTLTVVVFAEN
jgi:hypothetical protein